MQVKTFEALTLKDAIKQIKKEFGSEAVIVSTREKPIAGASRGSVVEVTAAIPESHRAGGSGRSITPTSPELNHAIEKLTSIESRISHNHANLPSKSQFHSVETGLSEIKQLLLESLRDKDGSTLQNIPSHLVNLDRSLRSMGVEEIHVVSLIKYLRALPIPDDVAKNGPEALEEHGRSQAMRWMLKRLKIAPRWTLMAGTQSVQAFVGPAGSGKTSVIAKIAAQYVSRENAKVAIFSCDTKRLAATEQLRLYAKILGIPFVAISSPQEIAERALEHRDRELILVDTAGRNTKNESDLSEFADLRSKQIPVDMHLVLSATEKATQLDRAVRCFAPLGLQSLIFSRLDESWTFGDVFNLGTKWSLPLSFFSLGPQIPEDLERATRERVIERIFGL